MFRDMRRNKQALSTEDVNRILSEGSSGVLAVAGDDGYPYAVPLSYYFENGKIYFHCAREGHKLDAILNNPKTSFCVIGQDKVSPEEYTTHYQSVIAFGQVHVIEDDVQKLYAIRKLARKYAPAESHEHEDRAVSGSWDRLCMLEMTIEHVTGKEARELLVKRG